LLSRPAAGHEQQAGAGEGCDTESAHQDETNSERSRFPLC
jgi:hypothetical protein